MIVQVPLVLHDAESRRQQRRDRFLRRGLPGAPGDRNDPRCDHCMMHCGFEPTAALGVDGKLGDGLKMLMWQLT